MHLKVSEALNQAQKYSYDYSSTVMAELYSQTRANTAYKYLCHDCVGKSSFMTIINQYVDRGHP